MEKFMLILREDFSKMRELADKERFSYIPEVMKWIQSISEKGNYVMGEALCIRGKYVTNNHVLSDGPFIESKEAISGYTLIWANDLDEAVTVAQSCPMVMNGTAVMEVRPIEANAPFK